MSDGFSGRPEQNTDRDRGADGDRKPVPHAHQRFGFASADANFSELRKANPDAETQGEKRTKTEQPTKVIQNPVFGSIDDRRKYS